MPIVRERSAARRMTGVPFRFDAANHAYYVDGKRVPSITQMLNITGHINDQYFTEVSRIRGVAVHRLAQDYDLGALDAAELLQAGGIYRGWLLAHVALTRLIAPEHKAVEVGLVDPTRRWAGKPDRVSIVRRRLAIVELKSGDPEKHHTIQTALQCILVAGVYNVAPHSIDRFAWYLKGNGRYREEQHNNRADFDEAARIITKVTT